MSFLSRLVGSQDAGNPNDGDGASAEREETIARICSRLTTASLLEDRRSAAQALKSAAKDYHRVRLRGPAGS